MQDIATTEERLRRAALDKLIAASMREAKSGWEMAMKGSSRDPSREDAEQRVPRTF